VVLDQAAPGPAARREHRGRGGQQLALAGGPERHVHERDQDRARRQQGLGGPRDDQAVDQGQVAGGQRGQWSAALDLVGDDVPTERGQAALDLPVIDVAAARPLGEAGRHQEVQFHVGLS
jgi:hypothetical protein